MLLKQWLKREEIPPYKFAKKMGISPATLYRNLNGERRMTAKHAVIVERLTDREVTRTEAMWPEDFEEQTPTIGSQLSFTPILRQSNATNESTSTNNHSARAERHYLAD